MVIYFYSCMELAESVAVSERQICIKVSLITHIRSAGRLNAAVELNAMYMCEQQSITELSELLYIALQL